MRNFKSLMLAAFAALACIALPSCSDDDDGPGSKSDFIGTWQKESTDYYTQFDSDGTGQKFEGSPESPHWVEPFAWRIKNGSLDIDYDRGDWTDIEHHEYRFSDKNNTLELRYFAKTKGDNYSEVDGRDWETYHKVGSEYEEDDDDEPEVKGSVSITNITAQKKTSTGLQINVTVSASGISASDVKGIGAVGGTSSNGNGSLYASLGSGKLSGTVKITSGLKSKTKYYIKAYLTTKNGTVYSSVRSVTTP